MICDLHLHTTASDGSVCPSGVVGKVKRAGINFCAITDHDCVSGLYDAVKEGQKLGVEVIRGIELSAYRDGEIHVLGYGMRLDKPFLSALDRAKQIRRERNLEVLEKLNRQGINIEDPLNKYIILHPLENNLAIIYSDIFISFSLLNLVPGQ